MQKECSLDQRDASLHTLSAGGLSSIPDQGTKIPMAQLSRCTATSVPAGCTGFVLRLEKHSVHSEDPVQPTYIFKKSYSPQKKGFVWFSSLSLDRMLLNPWHFPSDRGVFVIHGGSLEPRLSLC